MYRALVGFIRNRSFGVTVTCLAIGALYAAPALAAHMAGTERNSALNEATASTLEVPNRVELRAESRADPTDLRARTSRAPVGLSQPEESRTQDATNLSSHEVVTDSIGDLADFAGADVAVQPAMPKGINARIPGLSDDALARFKKRMYRKDI